MRWETPQKGSLRLRWAFALLPTPLEDGFTVWFESYWLEEVYVPDLGWCGWRNRSSND
jgi:hypothetical protein